MRFYFDFLSHDNEEIHDGEGVKLADWLAAHRHAVQIVTQTIPFIPEGPDWRGWRIKVTDENRTHLLTVLFPPPARYEVFQEITRSPIQSNVPELSLHFNSVSGF